MNGSSLLSTICLLTHLLNASKTTGIEKIYAVFRAAVNSKIGEDFPHPTCEFESMARKPSSD
jgi:hypothetical protein